MTLYDVTRCTVAFFCLLYRKLTPVAISWRNGKSIPVMGRNFLSSKRFSPALCLIQPPIQRVSERKWRRHEMTFTLPPLTRLINYWSLASTPSYFFVFFCLFKQSDNFDFAAKTFDRKCHTYRRFVSVMPKQHSNE